MKAFIAGSRWLLALLFLAGCAGELNTPGEALRVLGGNLPDAHLGEAYEESISVAGGLRPYSFEISGGELPPGLSLDGPNLRGTPGELGTFTFTVTASDANLSSSVLEHRLRVVELPPPTLDVVMPLTETRAPFTIRVHVEDARDLRGLRSRLRWDPDQFTYVEDSLSSPGTNYALFSTEGEDWLQVDIAWLATTFSGERQVFSFQLQPREAARPGLEVLTEFALDSAAGTSFERSNPGARVAAVQPAEVEPGAPESDEPETPAEPADEAAGEPANEAEDEPEEDQ